MRRTFGASSSSRPRSFNLMTLGFPYSFVKTQKYPVRIKCALLSWNTFLEGLKAYREKQGE
ncbi:MAG: hypothetical protein ACREJP_03795 [Candidatus Methylomirabilales bacterium]